MGLGQGGVDKGGAALGVDGVGGVGVRVGDGGAPVGGGGLEDAQDVLGAGVAVRGGGVGVADVEREVVQVRVGDGARVGHGVGEAVGRRVRVLQAAGAVQRLVRLEPQVRLHHGRVLLLVVVGAVGRLGQVAGHLVQVVGAERDVGRARRVQYLRYAEERLLGIEHGERALEGRGKGGVSDMFSLGAAKSVPGE